MALRRYFPGWSETRLLAEREKILTALAAGKMSTSAGAGDVNGSFQREMSLDDVLYRINCDLNTIDYTTYPPTDMRASRTTAIFRE